MVFGRKLATAWKKSETTYNKRYLKTKMKSYGDEVTDFHDGEIPKAGSNYTCLAVILIDFFL